MATLVPPSHLHPPALLPSGQLWLPRATLTACVRAVMVRSTVGHQLSDVQRLNHFPATPLCSLSWWFVGHSETVLCDPGDMDKGHYSLREPLPGRWVLAGPQTRPQSSWCPGPVHGMMVMLMPDALHLLTGLSPADLTDRFVDARQVLPNDWRVLGDTVQQLPDDASRLAFLEEFLEPRWQACRPGPSPQVQRYADWALYLAQRAAVSAPGRSLRQLERRIKRWAGLPLRELRGFGRAEQAFFDAAAAEAARGNVNWAEVAAGAGFADQPHLCRVTRRITGFAPQALHQGILRDEAFWAYRLWGG